jgi:hypothetical protein
MDSIQMKICRRHEAVAMTLTATLRLLAVVGRPIRMKVRRDDGRIETRTVTIRLCARSAMQRTLTGDDPRSGLRLRHAKVAKSTTIATISLRLENDATMTSLHLENGATISLRLENDATMTSLHLENDAMTSLRLENGATTSLRLENDTTTTKMTNAKLWTENLQACSQPPLSGKKPRNSKKEKTKHSLRYLIFIH